MASRTLRMWNTIFTTVGLSGGFHKRFRPPALFRETEPSYDYDWHPVPQRQFIIMLEGELEVEVGSGEKRHFSAGDVMLFEDTTGQGHRSRTTNNKLRKTIFVTLD